MKAGKPEQFLTSKFQDLSGVLARRALAGVYIRRDGDERGVRAGVPPAGVRARRPVADFE